MDQADCARVQGNNKMPEVCFFTWAQGSVVRFYWVFNYDCVPRDGTVVGICYRIGSNMERGDNILIVRVLILVEVLGGWYILVRDAAHDGCVSYLRPDFWG